MIRQLVQLVRTYHSFMSEMEPVRRNRSGPAGPDRLKWLDRPVFTGFYRSKEIFKSQKLPLVPLRVMWKIEFYNFPNMESFLIKHVDSKFRCNYQNNRIVFRN